MPEDNQPTDNSSTTDSTASSADSTNSGATTTNPEADIDMSGIDPNINIPSLEDLEYATPSAYIDPDLPANPTPIADPNEPEKVEEKAEETIEMTPEQIAEAIKASNAVMGNVAEKIANSRNILIALSSDPSIDELAGAIALAEFLDRLGKHAIAIYSGTIPSALEFLGPDQIFEKDADVLQDFVIALDKDKADHLRYKLEGDFVKIFITPYKDRIASEDLDFSYGDYNVDLVLALNINNGIDLDEALREYGTIMKDATVVNITTGNPGKFGEIEWSNKFASSVSEMIANLLLSATGDTQIEAKEATTILTGIVAATDRFAKANTFPGTMEVASKLLDAGADQQLVAANISDDLDNQFYTFQEKNKKASTKSDFPEDNEATDSDEPSISFTPTKEPEDELANDSTSLKISHGDEESSDSSDSSASEKAEDEVASNSSESEGTKNGVLSSDTKSDSEHREETKESSQEITKEPGSEENSALLNELKATEASLSSTGGEFTSEPAPEIPTLDTLSQDKLATPASPTPTPAMETTITPPTTSLPADATSKYSQMLEDAISNPAPANETSMTSSLPPVDNPAASSAPDVTGMPEVSGVPEINYGQSTQDDLLPPPPAPPVDVTASMPLPTPTDLPPAVPEANVNPANPAVSAAPDPSAFTIPGV